MCALVTGRTDPWSLGCDPPLCIFCATPMERRYEETLYERKLQYVCPHCKHALPLAVYNRSRFSAEYVEKRAYANALRLAERDRLPNRLNQTLPYHNIVYLAAIRDSASDQGCDTCVYAGNDAGQDPCCRCRNGGGKASNKNQWIWRGLDSLVITEKPKEKKR